MASFQRFRKEEGTENEEELMQQFGNASNIKDIHKTSRKVIPSSKTTFSPFSMETESKKQTLKSVSTPQPQLHVYSGFVHEEIRQKKGQTSFTQNQVLEDLKRERERLSQETSRLSWIAEDLRDSAFKQANQDAKLDYLRRRLENEVSGFSESISNLRTEMVSEIRKAKFSDKSKSSKFSNRIDSSLKEINKRLHGQPFIETMSFKAVSSLLERNNMVFLTGLPGDGKTFIAYQCAIHFQKIRAMKPFIVQYHRDWKTCIFPDNNLFVILEDFCETDVFSTTFYQHIEYHLDGVTDILHNQSSYQSNKVIMVLRKEILLLVRSSLEKVCGFNGKLIVDLSSNENYNLSNAEKDKMWKIYGGPNLSDVSFKNRFQIGFPKICQFAKHVHFQEKVSEFYSEIIRQIEPEFFLILVEICLNGERVCITCFDNEKRVQLLKVFLMKPPLHDLVREVSFKLAFASVPLIGVFLARKYDKGEMFLEFLHGCLVEHVASVILERNASAVFQLCSLKQIHFFKRILIMKNIDVSRVHILQWIVDRIKYELCFNSTDSMISDISNLEEWVEDDFIDVCLTDQSLSKAFSDLVPSKKEYLMECVVKNGKLNLMKALYSFFKKTTFLSMCSKKRILLTASETGSVDMIELLMRLGLRLNQNEAVLNKLLSTIIEKNHLPLLKHILKSVSFHKAILMESSFSFFQCGSKSRSIDMLTFLTEIGCNPKVQSKKNETILHMVAMYGNVTMLDWLYKKYPQQLRIKTNSGHSILHYSACNKDVEVLRFLLKEVGMDPYEKTKNDETLLHLAIKSGNSVATNQLANHYLDMVAMQDKNGHSTLHTAAYEGNIEYIKMFDLNKDIHQHLTKNGENILHCASKCKDLETFQVFMKEFFQWKDAKTKEGLTLLHTASAEGSLEIVKYLIREGFDVTQRTSKGETAIHFACQSGNVEVVKFLSQKYPDQLLALGKDGFDPMLSSAKSNSLETVQYLMKTENWRGQTSYKGQDIFHVACQYSNVDVVRYLYKCEISLKICDNAGKTALHYAAMNPSIDVIEYLLQIGLNRYALSAKKQTALHLACFNKNIEVFIYLWTELPYLRFQSDASGYSILHYSCEAGNEEALEFCLKEGFNIRSKTINNYTPLEIAMLNGQFSLAKIIKEKYIAQNWHSTLGNVLSKDMATFHEKCFEKLNVYDLAIIPQKIKGKPESMILAMCLIDPCIRKDKEDIDSDLRKEEDIFERLHKHTKLNTETTANTFQEVMLRTGIMESLDWYIHIAFLFPEEISDNYLKTIVQEIQTYEIETYNERNIIKAVTKGICKIFWMKYRDVLDISSVWTGYDCSVKKESLVCFDTIVVITKCKRNYDNIDIDTFYGLRIYYRDVKTFSSEAKEMMKYESIKLPSIQLSKGDMKYMLSRHSNITLISASSVKSKGFTENEQRNPLELQTVVIYCRVKGIIPVCEEMFPTHIGGYPVDIRESAVMLAAGEEGLLMGDKIGPKDLNTYGTLGGFVDIDAQRKGFITCAHVMRRLDTDNQKNAECMNSQNVCLIDNRGIHSIGHVVRETFTLDNNSDVDVSTDAVLIEIDNRYPKSGHFTTNLSLQNIRQADFRNHQDLMFTDGETAIVDECRSKLVMKVGASTGLTRGYVHFSNAEAIIETHEVSLQGCRYALHGQIEVKSHGSNDFIAAGDSGSFVFLIEKVDPPLLKCIGMVVARSEHETCLITPIEIVMTRLGLNLDQLSKFENDQEDILRKMFKEIRSQYSETNSNIVGLRNEVRESIDRLETKISSVEDRVESIETENVRRGCNIS